MCRTSIVQALSDAVDTCFANHGTPGCNAFAKIGATMSVRAVLCLEEEYRYRRR